MILVITGFPFVHSFIHLPFKSLFDFIQFFAIGFLLADFYVNDKERRRIPEIISVIFGITILWLILMLPMQNAPVLYSVIFPLLIFAFFYIALFSAGWKKFLSIKIITVTGGMCYSIYLIHFAVISILDNVTNRYMFTRYYWSDLVIQFVIIVPAIIVISAGFFLIIEKPCMDKNWPQELKLKIKSVGKIFK